MKILQQGLGSLRGAIGTPEQVARPVRALRGGRASTRSSSSCRPGRNRHEHICESLELFADEVMPEFAERRRRGRARRSASGWRRAIEAALARREPPRDADPDYAIAPDGLRAAGRAARRGTRRPTAARADAGAGALAERGEEAFAAFVRRSDDRRLERTVGSERGLRVLFGGMAQASCPTRPRASAGDIQYELRRADGER